MIALLLILGAVQVESSARYDSPYSIESIAVQEVLGVVNALRHSDEINRIKAALSGADLTRQRISDLARSVRAAANTLDVRHPASGQIGYSYERHRRKLRRLLVIYGLVKGEN